jgi:hypothetical protein
LALKSLYTEEIGGIMILKFFFKQLSINKQVDYLKKKGILLGTRIKEGRKIYIYMLRDLFVEVMFKDDNASEAPEKLYMLTGLKNLNSYLEKEFKTTF